MKALSLLVLVLAVLVWCAYTTTVLTRSPTIKPSLSPSKRPSFAPTTPTRSPSVSPTTPTRSPSIRPSVIPSKCPTKSPTLRPTLAPTSKPTTFKPSVKPTTFKPSVSFSPSVSPTKLPTVRPTVSPSRSPTVKPTTIAPSQKPSVLPSIGPTVKPTSAAPTSQPSSQPSCQPTAQPTSPTSQPSSQPSRRPSGHPSSQPSMQPFVLPSSSPSTQPTSSPSDIPDCPAGWQYDFDGINGTSVCKQCPLGYYAPKKSVSCSPAPKGYYAGVNFSEAVICPQNTFSSSSASSDCTKCGNGGVSPSGTYLPEDCVNPISSFVAAFLALCLCFSAVGLYIVGGRLHRMAYVRRETLVRYASKMFNMLCAGLLHLNEEYGEAASRARSNYKISAMGRVARYCVAMFLVVIVVLVYFLASMYSTFYTAVILYRGYSAFPEVNVPSLFPRLSKYVERVATFIHFPPFAKILYPFNYVLNFLADLNISFSAARVSCFGAQTPVQFLIDCIIVGLAIIVIESEVEVFWSLSFMNTHREFRKVLLRHQFWKNQTIANLGFFLWSVLLQVLPHPRSILQFGLGFFRIFLFFQKNGHAQYSVNCNINEYYGIDETIAWISTILAYLCVCPAVYILSQILVPGFALEKGLIKREHRISQDEYAREDRHCNICRLKLSRIYSSYFDVVHKKRGRVAVYACPKYKQCNWAVCSACFNSGIISGSRKENAGVITVVNPILPDLEVQAEDVDLHPAVSESLDWGKMDFSHRSRQSQERIESLIRHKHWYSDYLLSLKKMATIFAFDWYYVHFAFSFAQRFYPLVALQVNKNGQNVNEVEPKLAWFPAFDDLKLEETQRVEFGWLKYADRFPSYFRMVFTVYDDLMPRFVNKNIFCYKCRLEIVGKRFYSPTEENRYMCELCEIENRSEAKTMKLHTDAWTYVMMPLQFCVFLYSCTLIGQLHSEKGRRIWNRVVYNYSIFLSVIIGRWRDLHSREYELNERIEKLKAEEAVLSQTDMGDDEMSKLLKKADEQNETMQMISAILIPRIVLIQLIPFATFISVLAVNLCNSPILILDDVLAEKLPPLFVRNRAVYSTAVLQDIGIKPKSWRVALLSFYLFVTESRCVQFILNLFTMFVSVSLVFAKDDEVFTFVISVSIFFFFVVALIKSFYPLLIMLNVLFPSNAHIGRRSSVLRTSMVECNALNATEAGGSPGDQSTPSDGETIFPYRDGSIAVAQIEMRPLHSTNSKPKDSMITGNLETEVVAVSEVEKSHFVSEVDDEVEVMSCEEECDEDDCPGEF